MMRFPQPVHEKTQGMSLWPGAVLCIVGLLTSSVPALAQSNRQGGAASAQATPPSAGEPAALVVWNRPIAVFRAPFGNLSPKERVETAARRIEAIPESSLLDEVKADYTKLGDAEGILVSVGSRPAFGILREDLDPLGGETLDQAAAKGVDRLRAALRARHDQRSVPLLLRGIGLSLAATLLFALAIRLILRLRRVAVLRLEAASHLERLKVFDIDLRPQAVALERQLVRLFGWAVVLVGGYLWLTFVFSQFPYSQPWSGALASYLVDTVTRVADGAVKALPGLLMVAIIFLITRAFARLATGLFREVELGNLSLRGFQPETARATRRVVVTIVWLFAITVAYPYIPGSQTDAFKGVSLFAGLLFSLGSAGLLNQVLSGLVITYSRTMRTGEYVKVGDTEGIVTELGVLCTKIMTRKQEEVAIPNAVLVAATTTNYSRLAGPDGVMLSTSVTIGYDAPWRQVHALLALAAERTAGVHRQPRPRVLQSSLSDFFVEYILIFHIDRPEDRFKVLSDLHAQIQDAFNEYGVQIMSPHFEGQPQGQVLVPRGKWNAAPAPSPDGQEPDQVGSDRVATDGASSR
jgi:small-conductance mechanosensitive channel